MPLSPLQFQQQLRAADDAYHRGDYTDSIRLCRALLRHAPGRGEVHMVLSAALLGMGDAAGARETAEKGLKARPGNPSLLYALSRALFRLNRLPEARRAIDRALAERPGESAFLAAKADLLLAAADPQGAYDLLLPLAGGASPGLASALARAAAAIGRRSEAVDVLERALAGPALGPTSRSNLLYDLGETLDALGDYDRAFAAIGEANDLKRVPYDAAEQSRAIDAAIRAWTPEAVAATPRAPRTDRPAFIVGFWRSGTTLVEQTLACHPAVFGAGELDFFPRAADLLRDPLVPSPEPIVTDPRRLTRPVVERLAREYQGLLRGLAPAAARVTDKLPTNFLHLGLIRAVLPGARVVHCVRDAADTCLSCYFNMRGNLTYAHDLRELGLFYRDYRRLMRHWQAVLDLPLFEAAYEGFVSDQEATARSLVDFLGLPWHESCLRPHENTRVAMTRSMDQVRRPVYTSSVARWRRYEKHLGPLLDALA